MTQNPNTTAIIATLTYQQEVMQGFLDGKTILFRWKEDAPNGPWSKFEPIAGSGDEPAWNWGKVDYQVMQPKPQPIELSVAYVNCANPNCSGEHMVAAGSEDEVRGYMQSVPEHLRSNVTFKRFIEVVEG